MAPGNDSQQKRLEALRPNHKDHHRHPHKVHWTELCRLIGMCRHLLFAVSLSLFALSCGVEKTHTAPAAESATVPDPQTASPVATTHADVAEPANSKEKSDNSSSNIGRPDFKTITFPSVDGLEMTADLYLHHDPQNTLIVAFHQAGWSRGEYREIAPKLVEMGFNVLAVDARSGGAVNGVINETAAAAKREGKKQDFTDALQDLRAALKLGRQQYGQGRVLAWGSSYSSALVLRLAGTEPELADATLAFAPGEYFAKRGKSKTWIQDAAAQIHKPVFITSARGEAKGWERIYKAIPSPRKAMFVPQTQGNHGSRALWDKFSDSPQYWQAVLRFLLSIGEDNVKAFLK